MIGRRTILSIAAILMIVSMASVVMVDDSDASAPSIVSAYYDVDEDAFNIVLSSGMTGSDPLIIVSSVEEGLVAQGGGLDMIGKKLIYLDVMTGKDVPTGVYNISLYEEPGSTPSTYTYVSATGVTLNKSSLTLSIGGSEKLVPIVSPNGASYTAVFWSSTSPSVAEVFQDGTIRAKSAGTTTVTVETVDGHWSDTCTVTVTGSTPVDPPVDPPVTSTYKVTVEDDGNGTASASPSTATAGTTITLTATPKEGYVFKEWQTSSGVSITGNTFTMPSKNVTVKAIFEKAPVVVDVSFDRTTVSLNVGDTTTIKATVTPADAPDKSLSWSSSDTSVVTVDNGLVTAVGKGTAKVTATTVSGKTATCTVTVTMNDIVIEADDGQITESQISEVIDRVVPGQNVVLDATGSSELVVDADSVLAILDKGAVVTVDTDAGSVVIPKGSLSGIPTGQPMVVIVEGTEIPEAHADKVPEGSVVVDVTITVGDMVVTTFGTPITVSIPVGDDFEDTSKLKVYHLADDGTMTDMGATYDAATHSMVFQTGHLSIYAIVEEVPVPSEDKDNTMLYIGIAVVILIVIVLAAVLVMRKH